MNANPIQPDHDREDLARLLPGPVERDLPSGRHQRIQEFVMSQIHQDLQSAGSPRRRTSKRRPAFLAAALTAVAGATAVAVVIGSGSADSGGHSGTGSTKRGAGANPDATLSGRQVLFAAASTAERTSVGSGTYWHVKTRYTKVTEGKSGSTTVETWARRDGRSWVRLSDSGPIKENGGRHGTWNYGFSFDRKTLTLEQIQRLPANPTALRAWMVANVGDKNQSHGGRLTRALLVRGALIGLLSMSPAPPSVRAAAFRALAGLPHVRNLGHVDGGRGLQITDSGSTIRLVIDPATARVRSSGFVDSHGRPEGGNTVEAAEWTNVLPR